MALKKIKFRKPFALVGVPTEHAEQAAVVVWAMSQVTTGRAPALANLFAIPNGGHRNPVTAAKLKAEGVKPGVPDLMLAWPAGGACGLFLEMKRLRGGTVSRPQKEWRERLSAAGYAVRVCHGAQEAIEALREYLAQSHAEAPDDDDG